LYFGKIRGISKFPTAYDFSNAYARLSVASLIRAPNTSNVELDEESNQPGNFMNYVSICNI